MLITVCIIQPDIQIFQDDDGAGLFFFFMNYCLWVVKKKKKRSENMLVGTYALHISVCPHSNSSCHHSSSIILLNNV